MANSACREGRGREGAAPSPPTTARRCRALVPAERARSSSCGQCVGEVGGKWNRLSVLVQGLESWPGTTGGLPAQQAGKHSPRGTPTPVNCPPTCMTLPAALVARPVTVDAA